MQNLLKQLELETALAKAEAALAVAAVSAAAEGVNRSDADARLDAARARCRQARAALKEFHSSRSRVRSLEGGYFLGEDIVETGVQEAVAHGPPKRSGTGGAAGEAGANAKTELMPEAPLPAVAAVIAASATPKARPGPSVLRQTAGFLALVLAYLNFYHIEVQLVILNLPLVAVWLAP